MGIGTVKKRLEGCEDERIEVNATEVTPEGCLNTQIGSG